ncbi:sperm flagellar protein 2 [Oopsacas minuta]|uniref:Sperm flagellar protein 2 n=1 Tax=Oopsacas minuta TaxID=111878 RepID=A0AAV7JBS8_9METZ|nr:sperm flagellar protein 2 [Oopsacas minuta]
MAEILCRWVNKDIEPDTQLESDNLSFQLSNGYPYGLILFRYGMQEDFNSFHKAHSSEAKLNNFIRLEHSLRLLDIHLKPQAVSDIINQKGHAAVQLLYRLFVSLGSSRSELKRSLVQGRKTLGRGQLESSESTWYKDRLRQQTLRQSDLDFEALVHRYEEKRSLQEKRLRETEAQLEKDEIMMRQKKIAEQLTEGRMKRERQAQLYKSMRLSPLKTSLGPVTSSSGTGGSNKRLRSLTVRQNKHREAREVSELLEDFENQQLIHSIRPDTTELPPISQTSQTADLQPPVTSTESECSLTSSIPSSETGSLAEPDNRYVARLQTGGHKRREMAQKRAARRRRILAEQLRREECRADEQKEELLVKRLMRQSQQEQRAATQLLQIKQNKLVIRENRANKQKQLEEERRREFSEALDREAQLASAEKELYAEQIKQQQELHKELLHQKEKKNAEKSRIACQEIVILFADLACKIADYRKMTDKQIPSKVFKSWKALVLAGYSPFENETEEDYPPIINPATCPVPPDDQQDIEQKSLLDEQDFLSYLYWREEWSKTEDGSLISIPSNLILQHMISRLYSVAFPPPPPPTPPDLPTFLFTGCIIGPPFSGKSTILTYIAQRTGIVVLDLVKLVHEAITAHKNNEMEEVKCECIPIPSEIATQSIKEKPGKPKSMSGKKQKQVKGLSPGAVSPRNMSSRVSAKKEEEQTIGAQIPSQEEPPSQDLFVSQLVPTPRAVLGKQASDMLRRGDSIDDNLLIDILIHKIRQLPDGSSWIIDGFPKTLNQAQLLEKQLSGYEPPSDPPKLRTSREAREWCGNKLSILVHGLEHEQNLTTPNSYFKKIIFLNLPDKVAIRRGLGQQVNTRTKDKYHIEFNPAPSSVKQAELSRCNTNRLDMLQYMLANYTESKPALEEWFTRFGNVKFIEGANTMTDLTHKVEEILTLSITSPQRQATSSYLDTQDQIMSSEQGSDIQEESVVKPGEIGWDYCDKPIPNVVSNYLARLWNATEDYYINTCKEAFSSIRQAQHISCKYIYRTREEFREYLRRPDQKQVIVSQFQKKYNDLTTDLRADKEVKAEFHQQVDDLKKNCLGDISDKRKHDAELERAHIMENNWLEDNSGFLINLFISLLQAELSRFQDTMRLVHDYYESMRGRVLSETPAQIVVPLLELPDAQAVLESISGTCILLNEDGEGGTGEGEGVEEQSKSVQRPALMPRYEYKVESVSSKDDKGKKKLDKRASEKSLVSNVLELESADQDEHQLLQAYCLTYNNIHNMCYSEYMLKEEVEQERVEKDKREVDDKSKLGKSTPAKKGGKATPVGKKGTKPAEVTPEPVLPDAQLPPEVIKARKEEDNLLDEFMEAIKLEENYSKYRLEQLKYRGISVIRELKSKVGSLYDEMKGWIGIRFKEETSSINQLCQYIHQAIENEIKIKPVLNLSGTEFLIESSMVTYEEPPRLRPTTPPEDTANGSLSVLQLESLATSLSLFAPSGVISIQEFIQFLSDNSSKSNLLPEFSTDQLSTVLTQISWDGHYINWKNFIVSLSRPYPAPTLDSLMETLMRFRDRYPSGQVNKEEYLQEHLWFLSYPRDPSEYENLDALSKFDRNFMIRKVFFDIYADPETDLLDYEDMLLYFCADTSANTGLINALSLLKGIKVPLPESTTPEMMSAISFSQEELFKVFCHNQIEMKQSDISLHTTPLDIGQVFSQLDTLGLNELTYAQLLSYPLFTEVIHSSALYYLFDPSTTIFSSMTAQHSEISLISEHPIN